MTTVRDSKGVRIGPPEEGSHPAFSLFHFLTFLIFAPENRCESSFRPPRPDWDSLQTRLWADSGSALDGHRSADVRVVSM